jgi:hypothetical protein
MCLISTHLAHRSCGPGVRAREADIESVTNDTAKELMRRFKGGQGVESLESVVGKIVSCKLEAETENGGVIETNGDGLVSTVEEITDELWRAGE